MFTLVDGDTFLGELSVCMNLAKPGIDGLSWVIPAATGKRACYQIYFRDGMPSEAKVTTGNHIAFVMQLTAELRGTADCLEGFAGRLRKKLAA